MKKLILALAPAIILSGCTAANTQKIASPRTASDLPASAPTPSMPVNVKGLEAVMGKDAATLTSMFGEPRLNVQEVVGRKLQFTGTACVLDAYLYPEGSGGQEIVTHIDARRRDGAEVDRAACVNALRQR